MGEERAAAKALVPDAAPAAGAPTCVCRGCRRYIYAVAAVTPTMTWPGGAPLEGRCAWPAATRKRLFKGLALL